MQFKISEPMDLLMFAVVDLAIVMAVLFAIRPIFAWMSGVKGTSELADKDNFAFGIALGGATAAVAIMLSGVTSGEFAPTIGMEITAMLVFAAIGIVLMICTRLAIDKLTLGTFDVKQEIRAGNRAVAVVDAGNMIATAIVIRAIMEASPNDIMSAVGIVAGGFLVSQVLLMLSARYRIWLYAKRNKGLSFNDAIKDGNLALGLRFAGFQIAVALAVTAGAGVAMSQGTDGIIEQLLVWGALALGMTVVLIGLSIIAERCVLAGVNVSEEVDSQRNIGVAMVETSVYTGIGLLLAGLFGA